MRILCDKYREREEIYKQYYQAHRDEILIKKQQVRQKNEEELCLHCKQNIVQLSQEVTNEGI